MPAWWLPDRPGRTLAWRPLTLFALSMGYLESAVVVYLRQHWYPDGFGFPLVAPDVLTTMTELGREVATLVMLLTVAWAVTSKGTYRFAVFLFCFGIWDLAYYLFLFLLLGWPASLLDWDILFLIPVPWTGPVAAPLMLSLLMIILARLLTRRHSPVRPGRASWILLAVGSVVVIYAFCHEFILAMAAGEAASFTPRQFPWPVFIAGLTAIIWPLAMLAYWKKSE